MTTMIFKKCAELVSVFALLVATSVVAKDYDDPYLLIEEVGGKAFARIANEQESINNNPEILRDIVEQELMPYVDYGYAAYKIIGSNMRNTDKEQRAMFVVAVREYLIQTYAQVLTKYEDQEVRYEPKQAVGDSKIVSVRASIIDDKRPDINLDFKLRLNAKTREWKAFDMVVEGISLLNSKQAELGSLIRQNGIEDVAKRLIEKSKRPIVLDREGAQTVDLDEL